jgi:glyoxylase-like metal-dependent hydrolase (beta-lactamase superfamily II)
MRWLPSLLLALPAVLVIALPAIAQEPPDFSGALVDTLPVAGSVHLLRIECPVGNPSVVASVGDDGYLLVDSAFAGMGDKLVAALRKLGPGEVQFVVNTHPHWDHTNGNLFFGKDATILGRPLLREALKASGNFGEPMDAHGWPEITLDRPVRLHFNGETVEVIPMKPGHTNGDVIVYFEGSGVLATGDYFFLDRYPIIDTEGGGSFTGYFENIREILARFPDDTRVVPGHSTFSPVEPKIATLAEYRAWYEAMADSIDFIVGERKAGKSAPDIANQGMPFRFERYGERPRFVKPESWINKVYEEAPDGGIRP